MLLPLDVHLGMRTSTEHAQKSALHADSAHLHLRGVLHSCAYTWLRNRHHILPCTYSAARCIDMSSTVP
jgi:hypothetical protein